MNVTDLKLDRRKVLIGGASLAAVPWLLATGQSAFGQETPKKGGVLRIAQPTNPNPKQILSDINGNNLWRRTAFDTLVYKNADRQPTPLLATSWEFSDEGKTMVVNLREGVTFHTGRPFDAQDALFTLERMGKPEVASTMMDIIKSFTSMEATGTHQITIKSDVSLISRIFDAFDLASIVDHETIDGLDDGSNCIGTGPFLWKSFTPGSLITLEKNPNYWQPDRPYLDGIEVHIISDSTALANSARGQVDFAYDVAPRDAVSFNNNPSYELVPVSTNFCPLGVNLNTPLFQNKKVRQAIGYVIDRERILQQVLNGFGSTTCLWWPETTPGVEDLANYYTRDLDKARALMAEANVTDTKFTMSVFDSPVVRAVYDIVQFNLREIGLEPEAHVLDSVTYNQLLSTRSLGDSHLHTHGYQGNSPATAVDAMPALRANNPSYMADEKFIELKKKLAEANEEQSAPALHELTAYLLDEAFTHVAIRVNRIGVQNTRVKDLERTAASPLLYTNAWLDA